MREFPGALFHHVATPASYSPRRQGRYDADNLAGFADGVFAIAATLLVLDLKVPDHAPGGLGRALGADVGVYLSYALGFVLVLVGWVNCRRLLRSLRATDHYATIMITFTFGAWTLTPFTVSVLAHAGHNRADLASAARLMIAVVTATMIVWAALFAYARRVGLFKESLPKGVIGVYVPASQTIWLFTAAAYALSYVSAYLGIAGIVAYSVISLLPFEVDGA